jgi:hypothetical protein
VFLQKKNHDTSGLEIFKKPTRIANLVFSHLIHMFSFDVDTLRLKLQFYNPVFIIPKDEKDSLRPSLVSSFSMILT